eukprot:6492310-Amphidinium_carterae.4
MIAASCLGALNLSWMCCRCAQSAAYLEAWNPVSSSMMRKLGGPKYEIHMLSKQLHRSRSERDGQICAMENLDATSMACRIVTDSLLGSVDVVMGR